MSFESRLDRLLAGRPAEQVDVITASRLVFRIAHLLEARIDDALAPHGLVMREYLALVLIADADVEPLRPSDLGATLDATRVQVTRLLDGLEAKGLAERRAHAQDRRSLQLALTPAARALLRRAAPVVHAAYAQAWTDVSPAEVGRSLRTLRRVHDRIDPDAG